ncbi:hypothetical protein [Phytoactinopolyspora halotolerans]|uniref:Uncharacterized protein n=1 Tax=Phytoactinopolyspora halotolerans TaxID=1981512 RepID=A0A6L9SGK2_9ACTN|nr:hypothetical protein [Phytoactinopolyspora halotolerans]NEE04505.1 hypothetical protein [Phytoactinopolyspora halotolerans]
MSCGDGDVAPTAESGSGDESATQADHPAPPSAAVERPSSGPTSPDSLDPFEARLIGQLEAIGVDQPGRAQDEYKSAQIHGGWHGGRAFVHGYERQVSAWDAELIDEIMIDGVRAEVVRMEMGPVEGEQMVRFSCHGDVYEVISMPGVTEEVTFGGGDIEESRELARLLMDEIGCEE